MKNNYYKYLSKVAKSVNPYQWEGAELGKSLRFDANTIPFPPRSLAIFLEDMKKNCPINEYTDPSYRRLKQLIAQYEGVNTGMITVTNSGDEGIDILAKTFLNTNDYFIVTPPTYEMFTIQCEINKGKLLEVPLIKKTFEVDAEKIIWESKNKKVKLIFLCNPNNPTGTVIPSKTIEKIIRESSSIIVVDEVYREFYGKSSVPLLSKYSNLVILRSFSKFAAIAGARVGYLIANPFLTQKFESIRLPMGVSSFSAKLAEVVMEKDRDWIRQQVKMIIKERKRLTQELNDLGFYVICSQSNFLLVRLGQQAKIICKKLKQRGIVIRDRSDKKYLEGCVRITVRSPKENNRLIRTLKEILL